MIKLSALATAAVIAVGMCALSTDASAARGGVAHFGGARIAGNVGGWHGYRGYGYRRYGYGGLGYGWGGWAGYPAYASCYVWTPLGYVNECGYNYSYYW
jgi:hypothetical protein